MVAASGPATFAAARRDAGKEAVFACRARSRTVPVVSTDVVFHEGCPDGRTAAWLVGQARPDARWVPYTHGDPVPAPSASEIWVLDVAFPAPVLDSWAAGGRRVFVLDHHLTAARMLAGVDRPLAETLARIADPAWSGVAVSLVMERSGAGLAAAALEMLEPGSGVPEFVLDIEDRDLWRWSRPGSRQVCAAFDVVAGGPSPDEVGRVAAFTRGQLVELGAPLVQAFDAEVDELLTAAEFVDVAGYRVPLVRVPGRRFGSWVGHRLLEHHPDVPFAGYWFRDDQGRVQVGLRSEDRRLDVAAIAARFGGGGHRNASGLSCTALTALQTEDPAGPVVRALNSEGHGRDKHHPGTSPQRAGPHPAALG